MSDTSAHSGKPAEELPADELLAAELALGVLAGAERDAAAERAAREPAFARMVAAWEERLMPRAAEIAEASPSPALWDRIAAALPYRLGGLLDCAPLGAGAHRARARCTPDASDLCQAVCEAR